jgi:MoaA/NifB/PqqE/SkfB family radical SAM enzyme
MDLTILYRGPLSSCNYDCGYCPFAKRQETAAELAVDRRALERFVAWAEERRDLELGILFTPWGEALTRRWYQHALVRLSRCDHIRPAAIQTNLSCSLDWIEDADPERLALWTTYHPGQTERPGFLFQCRRLRERGISFSVGVVGLREHRTEIEALRAELPPDTYLWINAYKDDPHHYSADDVERFAAIDPHFPINNNRHPSAGRACRTGHSVISVDGDGTVRRCHFIRTPLGNLYGDDFPGFLRPRPCTNETCGCFIGYVHLEELGQDRVFGDRLLERIPLEYARS